MRRFLAKHQLPAGDADPRADLRRLAEAGHERGIRAIETFYSPATGTAYTLFEALNENDVAAAYARAMQTTPEVMLAERIHTELLDVPRRAR